MPWGKKDSEDERIPEGVDLEFCFCLYLSKTEDEKNYKEELC